MNFEMEATNILDMKAYGLANEENIPTIKIGSVERVYIIIWYSPMKKKKDAEQQKLSFQY